MADKALNCDGHHHLSKPRGKASEEALERAAAIFKALGDGPRLRLLELLMAGECCVSEIVESLGEKFSTISQRLRLLRSEGLIRRRREGTHLYYILADKHVVEMIQNALAHADELEHDPLNLED